MNTNKFIQAKEVVKILQISQSTLYKYVRQGKIPAYRICNGKVLFKEEEILTFLESCKVTPLEHIKLPEEPRVKVTPATPNEVLKRLKEL